MKLLGLGTDEPKSSAIANVTHEMASRYLVKSDNGNSAELKYDSGNASFPFTITFNAGSSSYPTILRFVCKSDAESFLDQLAGLVSDLPTKAS
jgi:hypothetical protein